MNMRLVDGTSRRRDDPAAATARTLRVSSIVESDRHVNSLALNRTATSATVRRTAEVAMADRKSGRLVHRVSASVEKAIPLKVTGITFKVTRKWKRSKDKRVGELIVNAGGIRWRGTRRWYTKRMTWEQVRALFEDD
jgi:hypothetical protein